ncbi:putative ataxin-3 [Apostichopus japonicus]|uniref:ubiquitinyl hydrolase 1 n=1 Tax=Stichopus japonicus TaxID=307972 RepID=A0A2G8LDA5_STIJA|nr:putative ataxin-3 [Apostichopus japonicus]
MELSCNKQEASLCAQHCLNSLLQGPYFSAVDLATIAHQLDESERQTMAEGDLDSPEYLQFLQQPSGNMDDSGFFSVQVISKALKVWGLDLIPFSNSSVTTARQHPEKEGSYICNFKEHWLTIRKIGIQWFNLNSLLEGPEILSETYLGMFLTQLQGEGYSIFVIRGHLPACGAEDVLRLSPAIQSHRPRLLSDVRNQTNQGATVGGRFSQEDLQRALDESQHMSVPPTKEQDELQEAIRLSIQIAESAKDEAGTSSGGQYASQVDQDELRRKRQAYFEKQSNSSPTAAKTSSSNIEENTISYIQSNPQEAEDLEDAMLAEAIKLSMEKP